MPVHFVTKEEPIPRKKAVKEPRQKLSCCVQSALDKKAADLTVLEVKEVSSFADYFVICHGDSTRQVRGIARNIEEKMKEAGFLPFGVEGAREGQWVLLDYEDIVVHVFLKPVREFYDLERLWAEAPRIPVSDASPAKAGR